MSDPYEIPEEHHELFFGTKRKLDGIVTEAQNIRAKIHPIMRQALAQYETTMKKIKAVKKRYDAVLDDMRSEGDAVKIKLADLLSKDRRSKWHSIDDCPDYWTELDTGKLRVEVKPGPEHEWHDEWRDTLLRGEASYGPQGPPPYPPFKLHPPWEGNTNMNRDHPNGYYFEEDSPRKLMLEKEEREKREKKAKKGKKSQKKQDQTSETGPFQQHSKTADSQANHDPSRPVHSPTQGSRAGSVPPSPPTKSSNSGKQLSKRDKGKGKSVDSPTTTAKSKTGPIADPSSASAPVPRPAPASASRGIAGSTVAGPSTAAAVPSTTTNATTITVATATPSKEETNQDSVADTAKDQGIVNVRHNVTKIKIKTSAKKEDVKGKGKAVDEPSNAITNSSSNADTHRVTKPRGSKQPAAVATERTIKRSQVVKGKYWVFRGLDSSVFGKTGRIMPKAEDKVNTKNSSKGKEKETVSGSAKDNSTGNGEGSSRTTAAAIDNNNNDSKDELALGQDSDDFDSGSETDDSKDSNFTLTSKTKKSKATSASTTAAAPTTHSSSTTTTVTTASSSYSSSNKRKRTTTDTGDEEHENAYYVLRCPLERDCLSESHATHNAPASIRGVFCRHPFKKRRAMHHITRCGLRDEITSEQYIWENCCLKVVPDRKNTPVNEEWVEKHNRTVMRGLVSKIKGKEKERLEKEMEEEL